MNVLFSNISVPIRGIDWYYYMQNSSDRISLMIVEYIINNHDIKSPMSDPLAKCVIHVHSLLLNKRITSKIYINILCRAFSRISYISNTIRQQFRCNKITIVWFLYYHHLIGYKQEWNKGDPWKILFRTAVDAQNAKLVMSICRKRKSDIEGTVLSNNMIDFAAASGIDITSVISPAFSD